MATSSVQCRGGGREAVLWPHNEIRSDQITGLFKFYYRLIQITLWAYSNYIMGLFKLYYGVFQIYLILYGFLWLHVNILPREHPHVCFGPTFVSLCLRHASTQDWSLHSFYFEGTGHYILASTTISRQDKALILTPYLVSTENTCAKLTYQIKAGSLKVYRGLQKSTMTKIWER